MDPRTPQQGKQQKPGSGEYISFYRTDFFEFGVTWIFDRGPYYIHALINLLGPVRRVTCSATKTWDEASTPTHFAGVLDFANGTVCTLLISSDVYGTGFPNIEVLVREGSLSCIDPN